VSAEELVAATTDLVVPAARRRMSILVVGAASRDIAEDDPRGWRLGGAVAYGALALGRLGLQVRALVGADAEAATGVELDLLRGGGVDVQIARLRRGPVFVNLESSGGRRQRAIGTSDAIEVVSLPDSWREADGLLLGPVAGELGPDWAAVGGPQTLVALGWQGLLRTLVPGERIQRRPPSPSALVRQARLVGLSRDDVERDVPLAWLEALLDPAASLLITDGDRGGLIGESGGSRARRWRTYRAIRPDRVVDSTGAGDVFLATLLATRLEPSRFGGDQALVRGGDLRLAAAAASLSVEAPGLTGVGTLEEVMRRALRASTP
jgi:sugar/nucleoside kinase (ribokinase family)